MPNFAFVGKVAAWTAFGALIFVLLLWGVGLHEYLPMLLAASGLICAGAAVTASLIVLSMSADEEEKANAEAEAKS
ncbi:hypothetical protein Pan216_07070 [Planctomycetes bacterium Pan216]|uniref:Uncharacterized protein n=1 Tax=Kolteria novifilia TaxID=2527975 RepID=A0A518AYS4_9BACT|nr:hypothetical protein Pan216_07070 [Planctomycetes bacterium Pan216]